MTSDGNFLNLQKPSAALITELYDLPMLTSIKLVVAIVLSALTLALTGCYYTALPADPVTPVG